MNFLYSVIILILLLCISSQGASISGKVYHQWSSRPCANTLIELHGDSTFTTTTDFNGEFTFTKLPSGFYWIEINSLVYTRIITDSYLVNKNSVHRVNIPVAKKSSLFNKNESKSFKVLTNLFNEQFLYPSIGHRIHFPIDKGFSVESSHNVVTYEEDSPLSNSHFLPIRYFNNNVSIKNFFESIHPVNTTPLLLNSPFSGDATISFNKASVNITGPIRSKSSYLLSVFGVTPWDKKNRYFSAFPDNLLSIYGKSRTIYRNSRFEFNMGRWTTNRVMSNLYYSRSVSRVNRNHGDMNSSFVSGLWELSPPIPATSTFSISFNNLNYNLEKTDSTQRTVPFYDRSKESLLTGKLSLYGEIYRGIELRVSFTGIKTIFKPDFYVEPDSLYDYTLSKNGTKIGTPILTITPKTDNSNKNTEDYIYNFSAILPLFNDLSFETDLTYHNVRFLRKHLFSPQIKLSYLPSRLPIHINGELGITHTVLPYRTISQYFYNRSLQPQYTFKNKFSATTTLKKVSFWTELYFNHSENVWVDTTQYSRKVYNMSYAYKYKNDGQKRNFGLSVGVESRNALNGRLHYLLSYGYLRNLERHSQRANGQWVAETNDKGNSITAQLGFSFNVNEQNSDSPLKASMWKKILSPIYPIGDETSLNLEFLGHEGKRYNPKIYDAIHRRWYHNGYSGFEKRQEFQHFLNIYYKRLFIFNSLNIEYQLSLHDILSKGRIDKIVYNDLISEERIQYRKPKIKFQVGAKF